MEPSSAWDLLARSPEVTLAATRPDETPLIRVLNAVLVDDLLLFHGAPAGDKHLALGRRAVASAYEVVARIPSYFVDPDKACPATTYYRSAQAEGTLLDVTDPEKKRAYLQAFMEKLQPEGGFRSLVDSGDLYAKDLKGVRVIGLCIDQVTGKCSLGQDRPAERTAKVALGLWRRGSDRDLWALEEILGLSPEARPAELRAPWGQIHVWPTQQRIRQHAALLAGQYWRAASEPDDVIAAISGSTAWVGAVGPFGDLLGAARAVTDARWTGQICDVVVKDSARGQGIGRKLVQVLLDHPAVRQVRHLRLGTKDKLEFYRHLGFVPLAEAPLPFTSHTLVLERPR